MEWQQLLGFYHVARLGSFTRAAGATFRSQSALTQQVKALEAEFQCRLFERSGRQVRLTAAGERLLGFAQELFARYDRLQEDLESCRGRTAGRLRLAAPFTTLFHLLPGVVQEYVRRFPQVELTILDRPQHEVISLVHHHEVDFGLALESLAPRNLAKIRWRRVRTVLMAPKGHPLTRTRRVPLAALARSPLILSPRSLKDAGRERVEEVFRREGLPFQVVMESGNVELSALYVEMGLGLAFATVSDGVTHLGGRNLRFLPLDHFFPPDHIAVIMKGQKDLADYKRAFLQLLTDDANREGGNPSPPLETP